ncbi:gamma-mobile-trio integrase GmtZ [Acinetobacter pittii]
MPIKTKTKVKKHDGRTSDVTFQWLVKNHGLEWEAWRQLAEKWISNQDTGIDNKINALCIFFNIYLVGLRPFTSDIESLFLGKNGWRASTSEFKNAMLEKTNRADNTDTAKLLNHTKNFIDWLLDTYFSQESDKGKAVRMYANPFDQVKSKFSNTQTVHNPLPYRYICDLRHILCPQKRGNYSDWLWAQKNAADGVNGGDWFEVDKEKINKNDKDCVWRIKQVTRKGKRITIYQMWSPVISMILFIKLHLPLRTYQVRMLDSGEADTLRYESGTWVENTCAFAFRNYSKGVFRRFKDHVSGLESVGLYISTNKTADQNKDEFERGYEIPWQNEDVIYWLEKLRNWQEKYNSIHKPTDCLTLESKHTTGKKSKAYLSAMGHCCFLFRDATANNNDDRHKPVQEGRIHSSWYKLLQQLENNLFNSGNTLSNGTALQLVHKYEAGHNTTKTKTEFPLHSLRVSLITSYIIEAKLPLPVVSKLLAGHSRIIMTIYYTKLTPAVMRDKMIEAEELLDSNSHKSVRTFLKDAELRQIKCKTAYKDDQSIQSALVNRNPIGWENRHHGLCLAGGNNSYSVESGTTAGCWNGGELSMIRNTHQPVPHGPENCVRCRWFITDARYLPALNAHLNFMSYKAHETANLAVQLEKEIGEMEEYKYQAEYEGKPFTQYNKLQALQRRYEKQLVEADEYTKNWIATFSLIRRIIEIEQNRTKGETANKLIALGSKIDVKIGFMETDSELLQLALLCEDAEIYPDMLDDMRKTAIIERRTQSISRFMMHKGYIPKLLMLDQEQQLIATNAMMRQMTLQANSKDKLDGYKQVVNYLELGQYMQDSKLLDTGVKALENVDNRVLKLSIHDLKQKENSKGDI